jgi:hypothetical protein
MTVIRADQKGQENGKDMIGKRIGNDDVSGKRDRKPHSIDIIATQRRMIMRELDMHPVAAHDRETKGGMCKESNEETIDRVL